MPRVEASRRHILPPPYVVNRVNEGLSFGVIIAKEERSHPPQLLSRPDWPYGDRVPVEKYVGGRELTSAVTGDKVLDIIEILPSTGAFTITTPNMPRAVQFTSCRLKLNQIFTVRFNSWR